MFLAVVPNETGPGGDVTLLSWDDIDRNRGVPASSICEGCGHVYNPLIALSRIFQDQASGDERPPTHSPLETGQWHALLLLDRWVISEPQFETGAAGTAHFEPGG